MPSTLTYPGVYIEEIPSGVRPINGVATSITAFIGRALRGPTDKAVTINTFGDFERVFGGLWLSSSLGFAVRDFYLNGGRQAIIVRLYRPEAAAAVGAPAVPDSKAVFAVGGLSLEAASEGAWGANLRIAVDTDGDASAKADVAAALGAGLNGADLFNVTIRDASPGGSTERFLNLTVKDSARRVDKVLEAESGLVKWKGDFPNPPPGVAAGDDKISTAEKALADARAALRQAMIADPSADHKAEKDDVAEAEKALAKAQGDFAETVSNGRALDALTFLPKDGETEKKGLYALEKADLFNLLSIPPYTSTSDVDDVVLSAATAYCEQRRAFHLIDPPSTWTDKTKAREGFRDPASGIPRSRNAAIFFPRLRQPNLLRENRLEAFVPSGAVAGVFARTDAQRGVWKAPAGLDATLSGVPALEMNLTDDENGELNVLGLNCLRTFPIAGRVVWGARTLRGADQLADEWKYVPVRRTALFIEESLYRGTQWVVFEPNDEPLWAQIRLNVGAFMNGLFRRGAFQGKTPDEAYFVRCDSETTTQNDIDLGIVNILVGFAPLKPAEFVVIKLQQIAGEILT